MQMSVPIKPVHAKPVFPLSIYSDDCALQIEIQDEVSVRQALDLTELRVRAACGGMGTCGACLIKVVAGEFNPPTLTERQKIAPDDLAAGLRLACQLRARSQGKLYLEHPAPCSNWKSLNHYSSRTHVSGNTAIKDHPYGVAVDLGTTQIRLSLWNRQSGRLIASRIGNNPQVAFGADVLTRLDANRLQYPANQLLCHEARKAIMDGVRDILSRDMGEITPMLAQIGKVLLVGNTVMLTLICGGDSDAMYELDNWHHALELQPDDLPAWRREWRLPHADICIAQPLSGFVGSDLLADLLAIDITEQACPVLLADLGTNTEVALWDGKAIWVTSVPGGPAFEGVGMRNGLTAELGAIFKIDKDAEGWQCRTIGDTAARGLCASGFIDAIALLLAEKHLKPSGRFSVPASDHGFLFEADNNRSAVFASDIDMFQRAKASTAAAMAQLLKFAGLEVDDLQALWICGSLGQHLDFEHAVSLGLLPAILPERVKYFANASLAGCEELLLHPAADAKLNAIKALTKAVNLGSVAEYEELFIENLRLQPISLKRNHALDSLHSSL